MGRLASGLVDTRQWPYRRSAKVHTQQLDLAQRTIRRPVQLSSRHRLRYSLRVLHCRIDLLCRPVRTRGRIPRTRVASGPDPLTVADVTGHPTSHRCGGHEHRLALGKGPRGSASSNAAVLGVEVRPWCARSAAVLRIAAAPGIYSPRARQMQHLSAIRRRSSCTHIRSASGLPRRRSRCFFSAPALRPAAIRTISVRVHLK